MSTPLVVVGMSLNGVCSRILNGSSDESIVSQRVLLRVYGIRALVVVVTQRDTNNNERRRHVAAVVSVRPISNVLLLRFLVTCAKVVLLWTLYEECVDNLLLWSERCVGLGCVYIGEGGVVFGLIVIFFASREIERCVGESRKLSGWQRESVNFECSPRKVFPSLFYFRKHKERKRQSKSKHLAIHNFKGAIKAKL